MQADEIRRRFLDYFQLRGHELRPSGSLVPANDPTLLFNNAGMVPFKDVFLGQEEVSFRRAVTTQKCVRAGGKHNDLEEVGRTARHHTFFEMLGNFSFGDYFKRDAIHFAWEFLTVELGLDPSRLFVTVHHTDDEAHALWKDVAGLEAARIHRLGDADNFWQMADTGPCGPCSEIHWDLRPEGQRDLPDRETFEALGEAGEILELWNLVFMQYDRDGEGTLHPLPKPSIDTGMGLERLAAVLQGADSNYHTDLFRPLLETVARHVGRPYEPESEAGTSYRVLADHARAVAFLLADGVFPSSDGRGYVLRRILRRAVRHAWLLDRREPTLVHVVEAVLATMGAAWPELSEKADTLLATTRREEERFLATIADGMARFDELAPEGKEEGGTIPGEEAFRLYDTFGFPLDLTELMARERGWTVDRDGFEAALEEQRSRSRADRAEAQEGDHERLEDWTFLTPEPVQSWTGWDRRGGRTRVVGVRPVEEGRAALVLEEHPFYLEAGGQVSDSGRVEGEGWSLQVEEVRAVPGLAEVRSVRGPLEGTLPEASEPFPAQARVDVEARHDTERNHTATHLLHAALRAELGDHVQQRGSLVDPRRLRFDFSHPEPLTPDQVQAVEDRVNRQIWEDHPVEWEIVDREAAEARGAMALFGEKYGDRVRVVDIPGVSLELCGGTHLRHTGEAGLFRIVRETGIAAGVRRVEAVTGPRAFRLMRSAEEELDELARSLRASRESLPRRVAELEAERRELQSLVEELRRSGGGGGEDVVVEETLETGGGALYRGIRMRAMDADDVRARGDAFR
ncbi:MAG: alanine--tRNA ligase, partial [Gemmatimonadales bacterium]